MNNKRRKAIDKISEKLADLSTDIDSIMCEEQECFDNSPEGIQNGDRGTAMEEAVSNLQEAIDAIDEVINYLESAKE